MFIVDKATKRDITEIFEIDRQAFGEGGVSEETLDSQLDVFGEGSLVARCKDGVVGVICCERHKVETYPMYAHRVGETHSSNGNLLYISVITVMGDWRGNGIGSRLIGDVSNLAKSMGASEMYCPVNKRHPYLDKGVMNFWQKNGFEIVGEVDWEVAQGKLIDSFILKNKLL